MRRFSLFLLIFLLPLSLMANEEDEAYSGQGEVTFEYRKFEGDGRDSTTDTGVSIFSRVEASYEKERAKNVFRGFARIDREDPDRGLILIEDAYFSLLVGENEEWKFLAGYKIFNWTATEAFHPADVVNSRNLDSNLENLEKKGQLTFEAERSFFEGSLAAYLLPYNTAPEYPGMNSRLGAGVVLDEPIWVNGTDTNSNKKWVPNWAVRLTQSVWDGDFSFHVIQHWDRDRPLIGTSDFTLIPNVGVLPNNTNKVTIPHFFKVLQVGGTYQKPFESLILKIEAAHRVYEDEIQVLTTNGLIKPVDHTDVAFGFEYPFEWGQGMETFVILEGQMTLGTSKEERARINIFQRDALIGFRHSFNDLMGKEVFASFIIDGERSKEYLFNLDYSQRLSDNWKVKTGMRLYEAPQKGSIARGLEVFDGDHHIHFSLSRFF